MKQFPEPGGSSRIHSHSFSLSLLAAKLLMVADARTKEQGFREVITLFSLPAPLCSRKNQDLPQSLQRLRDKCHLANGVIDILSVVGY